MQVTYPKTRRWTRDEYYRMADLGMLDGQHVELIDGEIVEMAPQNNPHMVGIGKVDYALRPIFPPPDYWIRIQGPLYIADGSEPEPDVAVVPGRPDDYTEHPRSALLVMEVSESTLHFDRHSKASLYASASVEDYWIVNLIDHQVEVLREPVADRDGPFGWRYAWHEVVSPAQSLSPRWRLPRRRSRLLTCCPRENGAWPPRRVKGSACGHARMGISVHPAV